VALTGVEAVGEGDVLILSEPACYKGLNLQRACNSIFFSNSFAAGQRGNAEDRCHRLGSEMYAQVTYYDLVIRHTTDEAVLKPLYNKALLAEAILNYMVEMETTAGQLEPPKMTPPKVLFVNGKQCTALVRLTARMG
jgi:hypothetical protein